MIGEADPFIARLLHRFVERSGLQAVHARAGEELLELVRQVRPAVIILEAELPGKMRGWEAARALQADPQTRNIPIITCSWLEETDARVLVGEVSSHLQKPELHCDDFGAALRKAGVEAGQESPPGTSGPQPGESA